MTLVAQNVKIVLCKQAPQLVDKRFMVIDETKHSFVLAKVNNLIVDKKIRLRKAGLEIMVENVA